VSASTAFIDAIGQRPTFNVGLTGIYVGGLLTFAPLVLSRSAIDIPYGMFAAVVLTGISIGLVSGLWLCLRIQCPKCRCKVLWHAAASRQPPS